MPSHKIEELMCAIYNMNVLLNLCLSYIVDCKNLFESKLCYNFQHSSILLRSIFYL